MLNEMTCWSSVTLVLLGSVLKENKVSRRCAALVKSLPEKKKTKRTFVPNLKKSPQAATSVKVGCHSAFLTVVRKLFQEE